MASPFPGMDPYLEQPAVWLSFHLVEIDWLRGDASLPIRWS
ncbi:MAG: DUF4058 family protein [Phormidesmis sp.]